MLSFKEKEAIRAAVEMEILLFGTSDFKARPKKLARVYAFEMSNNTIKIGVSNNIKRRMTAIKASSGLEIMNYYCTEFGPRKFMFFIERCCKKKFRDKCIQGEFFAITFAEACALLDSYADEITNALRTADEKFLDEIAYREELKIIWEKQNAAPPKPAPIDVETLTFDEILEEVGKTARVIEKYFDKKYDIALEAAIETVEKFYKVDLTIIKNLVPAADYEN